MSLSQSPDGPSSLQELLLEWEDGQRNGRPREPRELCRDCPEFLAPLEEEIRILELLNRRFGTIPQDTGDITCDTVSEGRTDLRPSDRLRFRAEYVLQRFHAQGGLGVVYVAHDRTFQRDVAVKFSRRRQLTPADQARFRREAEITGRLEHPGIVPVYAVDPIDRDDPCFVMRWVEGETLQVAVDRLHASSSPSVDFQSVKFRGLLQRFVSVCYTTAYAHKRGVIHRDIKPRNIMLGSFGETLLLDWGLAKQLGETGPLEGVKASEHDSFGDDMTRPGDVLGTMAYASPEQLSGQSAAVDFRSDVFSLGATLYSLLTGKAPFDVRERSPNEGPLARSEIKPPRTRNHLIPRALEAICLHALSATPSVRYATAKELAEEIERYLADEPVRVDREPPSARLFRWLRKHRTGAASAAAAVLVSLLAVTCGFVLLGGTNRELARLNQDVRDRLSDSQAHLDLAVSAVDQFCINVSDELRLEEADLNPLRRKLLSSAVSFHEELLNRRGASSMAHLDLARSYGRLAMLAREIDSNPLAIDRYRDAILEYRAALKERPRDKHIWFELIQCLTDLGHVLTETGQIEPAMEVAKESLVRAREFYAWKPPAPQSRLALENALVSAAFLHESTRDYKQAEVLLVEAVAIGEANWKSSSDSAEQGWPLARSQLLLGQVYIHQGLGNWREAEVAFRKARDIGMKLIGKGPGSVTEELLVAKSQMQLGIVNKIRGRAEDARTALQAAIAIDQSLCQRFPSVTRCADHLADAYKQLGHVESLEGRKAEAEVAYQLAERTLDRLIQLYPGNLLRESIRADMLTALAEKCRLRGDLAAALGYADQAVDNFDKILKLSPNFANAITLLPMALSERATCLTDSGEYPEALRDWDRLLSANHAAYLEPSYQIRRARALVHLGKHVEATTAVAELLPGILEHSQGHRAVEILLLAARIEGQALLEARQDTSRNSVDVQSQADQYAQQAIDYLHQAQKAGLTAEDMQLLREWPELEALRKLDEFRELFDR